MRTVLVTGATGCVGSNLVRRLAEGGDRVRAFCRPAWKGREREIVGAEPVFGEILDREALTRAAAGCDLVVHCAAVVSFLRGDRDLLLSVNAGGTKAVAEACRAAGVGRLVHVSSVAAVGRAPDGALADERTLFDWPSSLSYRWSKHLAEREVAAAVGRGLDAVTVNPSVIVGPGDRYVHGGQLVRDAARGRLFAHPGGGMNLVGVHDVVDGILAAAERGRAGERYILGGTNLTHREAFAWTAALFGAPGPKLRIPRAAVLLLAHAAEAFGRVTGTRPLITPDLVAGAGRHQWFSIGKARRELGYNPVSLERSLREAHAWYRERDML